MKYLAAPWRSAYVTGLKPEDGCVLCGIGREPEKDRENYVLHREDGFFVVLNRYPYINGHMMIVPLRHAEDFSNLDNRELNMLSRLIVKCEKALVEGMNCMGMNGGWNLGGCAGAGIEGHMHVHMLPRWSGDTNFMTTTGETRVISASLEDSYSRLKHFFNVEVT
ncbi:MAG: HIT domain-containing protein [Candidatus Aegiribacteria sp.]|nr:HIT domain-containing protein [Candidatus Aegiribacteria sp.]